MSDDSLLVNSGVLQKGALRDQERREGDSTDLQSEIRADEGSGQPEIKLRALSDGMTII
jgi:hypothetical protein